MQSNTPYYGPVSSDNIWVMEESIGPPIIIYEWCGTKRSTDWNLDSELLDKGNNDFNTENIVSHPLEI